jgi:ABC-type protease/lipase transport system fused ATPase/permease subunit
VVVLDEPNANLDADGEKLLNRSIIRAKQVGTTVIVVTQRMSILQHIEKVLVLKAGQVEQFTEPSSILKANVRPIGKPAAAAAVEAPHHEIESN